MSTLAIILIVLAALLVLLAVGGSIASARRSRDTEAAFRARLEQANEQLAHAHAQDKGWERAAMEAAARDAFTTRMPDASIEAIHLVHVVDRPGTEDDEAHFQVHTAGGVADIVLGRTGDTWVPR